MVCEVDQEVVKYKQWSETLSARTAYIPKSNGAMTSHPPNPLRDHVLCHGIYRFRRDSYIWMNVLRSKA